LSKKIAQAIINQGADYLLAVKGNQTKLADSFTRHFPMHVVANYEGDPYSTQEKNQTSLVP